MAPLRLLTAALWAGGSSAFSPSSSRRPASSSASLRAGYGGWEPPEAYPPTDTMEQMPGADTPGFGSPYSPTSGAIQTTAAPTEDVREVQPHKYKNAQQVEAGGGEGG